MERVPITFEYKGKIYSGHLCPVSGAGGTGGVWHLMINKYYYGQLIYTVNGTWSFGGNQMTELADYFGDYLTAWYE